MKPCTVCGTDVTGTCHVEVRSAHYLWARGTLPKTTYYCTAVAGKLPDGTWAILHGRGGPHDVPERPIGEPAGFPGRRSPGNPRAIRRRCRSRR